VQWHGRSVRTSIFKRQVPGRVRVTRLNIEGDRPSDLSVHGGPEKAVYGYPDEHYSAWRKELPDVDLAWGGFGENLTTEGLLETEVCIGDRYRIGTAEFVVTQPRTPCYKLGIRFGRPEMVKLFHQSGSRFGTSVRRRAQV
jgi:MOSC domain-containing protein YiiM